MGECLQAGLLYDASLGGEDDIVALDKLLTQSAQTQEGIDAVARIEGEHILYGPSLGVFVAFRNLITLHPVAAALLGEEEHRLVHRGGIDKFGEVLVPCLRTLGTYATACLLAEAESGVRLM